MNTKLADIKTDFSQWYHDVIYEAQLADQAPVRGCMVIRPYGYALWEIIRDILDKKIKETGHQNAAFPLLIPQSFLSQEAEHVEGFAPEVAVVTHAGGKELEEPLIVRPTSETIIHYMFARWITSWRDLPYKINQWANIIRWEMRTRPFLRTTEIFWQEGHTAHETEAEAQQEALTMLNEYYDLIENYLAIAAVKGVKSESEKFAGADKTYTVEALMQDGKALQMCTSHLISRNFSRAFGIQYQTRQGTTDHPYLTSWGATTRLIGALVMVHGDQKGIVMPPKVAPIQVVIVPIYKTEQDNQQIKALAHQLKQRLSSCARVHIDEDEHVRPGQKFYTWELKGVPLRIEIGPKDVASGTVVLADRLGLAKETISINQIIEAVPARLELIHQKLLEQSKKRLADHWHTAPTLMQLVTDIEQKHGFYQTGWCRKATCEAQIKEHAKATIRCLLNEVSYDACCVCGDSSFSDVLVARSY